MRGENLLVGTHKGSTKEFRDTYDAMKWDTPKKSEPAKEKQKAAEKEQ